MILKQEIFRKYDIRGIWNVDFDIEGVSRIADALACYFRLHDQSISTVLLGCDARLSSVEIKDCLVKTFIANGYDVVDVGMVTTPLINAAYYLDESFVARIMVTASHNPWEFNGLKIFFAQDSVWDLELRSISEMVFSDEITSSEKEQPGVLLHPEVAQKLIDSYLTLLCSHFESIGHLLHNKKIMVDFMNGAGGEFVRQIFLRLGLEKNLFLFREEPYCNNPKNNSLRAPDPTDAQSFVAALPMLQEMDLDYSLIFDGDVDRFVVLHSSGRIIKGDELLILFAQNCGVKKFNIVTEVVSSSAIDLVAKDFGSEVFRCPVGISSVKKKMKEVGALLGGESSSHFIFLDKYLPVDDAIYAACRFLAVVLDSKFDFCAWLQSLPSLFVTPALKYFFSDRETLNAALSFVRVELETSFSFVSDIDGIKYFLSPNDWVLVRPSNTENCLTVRWQALTEEVYLKLENLLLPVLNKVQDKK